MPGIDISPAAAQRELTKRQLGQTLENRRLQQSLSQATKRTASKAAKKQASKAATKAVAGGVLKKVFGYLTKPWVAAGLLFFDILLADGGIVDGEKERASIERWNREVGEQQTVGVIEKEWYGGQDPSKYYRLVYTSYGATYRSDQPAQVLPPFSDVRIIVGGEVVDGYYVADGGGVSTQVLDSTGEWKFWFYQTRVRDYRIIGFEPTDGSVEENADGSEKITSESTVDYSTIKVTSSNFPSPPFPSDRKAQPIPSPSFKRQPTPVPEPTQRLKVEPKPLPRQEPIPEPKPIPEKTIEEAERERQEQKERKDGQGEEADDTNKKSIPPPKPNYFSERTVRRADGTTETIRQREATEEELRDAKRNRQESQDIVNEINDKIKLKDGQPSVLGDVIIKTDNTAIKEDVVRIAPLPTRTDEFTPKPVQDDDTIESDDPQPDDNGKRFIPPPPVQTPNDKCRGTCAGKNGVKLDKLSALLGGTSVGQNQNIIGIVQSTNDAVLSSAHGLAKIQGFAETAWKATRVSKVLEYLSLAATIHNAAMLSRNLGGSLGDTVSAIANNTISLIKNEESNAININETLGNTIEGFLKGIIGAENYTGVSETLSKYNRIISAASNVIYSVSAIQAGLSQGLETIGSYTGRIGNALKKSGAVLESSYGWMSEKVSVKTGRIGQIQRILDGGEQIENFASEIQNATSEFREAQENVTQIGQEFDKVKQEFVKGETEKDTNETATKTSSQGASPELTDFTRDPLQS